jgi:hypothetical protein
VTLRVNEKAVPGRYNLAVGLYNAQEGGKCLPLYAADGQPIPDASLILSELSVEP